MEPQERLAKGYVKRIYVNRAELSKPDGQPITVATSSGIVKATQVEIRGASQVVYTPESKQPRIKIVTRAAVEVQ